jgi:superfamily I DNA/RNA helicase
MEEELARGTEPARLAYVSFTRAAIREAVERMVARFPLTGRDLPYCRTIHSLTFFVGGLCRGRVLGPEHVEELSKYLGVRIQTRNPWEVGEEILDDDGTRGIFLEGLARSMCRPLREVWETSDERLSWQWLEWCAESLRKFKREQCLLDYTDMLEAYVAAGDPVDVDVAIIDEAQDLTMLQWQVVRKAFGGAKRLYISGDDDQAIYRWAGAAVDEFLALKADAVEVLPCSYRLAPAIFEYSQSIIRHVGNRFAKHFSPVPGREGRVIRYGSLEQVDIEPWRSWLLLARNRRDLAQYHVLLKRRGLPYISRMGPSVNAEDARAIEGWLALQAGGSISGALANLICARAGAAERFEPDAQISRFSSLDFTKRWYNSMVRMEPSKRAYYSAILENGFSLTAPPTIHVETIHGVKGAEAEEVVLLTNLSKRTYRNFINRPDDEIRVWYVGATRTRSNLHIVEHTQAHRYPF